jgi:16S rRNA processing protein RimM
MGSDWLPFGILRRPHGIKGEMLLHPYNPTGARLSAAGLPSRVRVGEGGTPGELGVASAKAVPEGWLVRFDGIMDREAAAALVGEEVSVPRRALAPLGSAEFYVEDIVGCEVFHLQGRLLGRVSGTFWNGAQDIMVVRTDDGSERLLPVVAEYVLQFDGERRRLMVDPHE